MRTEGAKTSVIDPTEWEWDEEDDVDWGSLCPGWLTEHGTVIVLLGNQANPDTVLGNVEAGEGSTGGLTRYLNERFWDLSGMKVVVAELKSDKKANWPRSPDDKDDKRRPNNRTIRGAKFYLDRGAQQLPASRSRLRSAGICLSDRRRPRAAANTYACSTSPSSPSGGPTRSSRRSS